MLKTEISKTDLEILDVKNDIKYLLKEQLNEFCILNLKNYKKISNEVFNFNEMYYMYEELYLDLADTYKCINLKGHILFRKGRATLIELEKILNDEVIKYENNIVSLNQINKLYSSYQSNFQSKKLIYELTLCKQKINECLSKIDIIFDKNHLNEQKTLTYKLMNKFGLKVKS